MQWPNKDFCLCVFPMFSLLNISHILPMPSFLSIPIYLYPLLYLRRRTRESLLVVQLRDSQLQLVTSGELLQKRSYVINNNITDGRWHRVRLALSHQVTAGGNFCL